MKENISHNIGRKISKIRDIRGVKQEHLAMKLGISQQAISRIEQSETVEEEILEKIAEVLGVTSEAIKSFSEDAVVNYFNTFNDSSINHGPFGNCHCTFNPLDKLMELVEENKKLHNEKVALLERLLQAEKEKNELTKGNK